MSVNGVSQVVQRAFDDASFGQAVADGTEDLDGFDLTTAERDALAADLTAPPDVEGFLLLNEYLIDFYDARFPNTAAVVPKKEIQGLFPSRSLRGDRS